MEESEELELNEVDGVIEVVGEIDASTAGQLADAIAEREGDVVIDVAGVAFIDSSGIRALIASQQAVEAQGATLTIRNPSPAVLRLFQLSSLEEFFNLA
ncbi:MAG: STAS domain-containing protein [Ilumatobacteraceae bacterium]|nr:STAS domain-containing protein [Ilumatobacteraceae bacterium]